MTKKLENRVNLYFNKSQQDVCQYLNNIEDKSAFVVEIVRKHMHNQQILGSGISEDLEFIKESISNISKLLENGVEFKPQQTKMEDNNVSEKIINNTGYSHIDYDPEDDF